MPNQYEDFQSIVWESSRKATSMHKEYNNGACAFWTLLIDIVLYKEAIFFARRAIQSIIENALGIYIVI